MWSKLLPLAGGLLLAMVVLRSSDEWFAREPNVDAIHAENARHERERAAALPADFVVPPTFADMLIAIEKLTGSKPVPFLAERDGASPVSTPGFAFAVANDTVAKALSDTASVLFRPKGFSLFAYQSDAGLGPSSVVAWPDTVPFAAIESIGTQGGFMGPEPAQVATWFRDLAKEQPFVISAIGRDFVQGRFLTDLRDASALAKRFNDFCPDIVRQGTRSVRALEIELRESGHLFCWWD